MMRDLRTLIYLLNLKLRKECSRTLGPGMQSGSSSRSGRNRACSSSGGRDRGAAVEADAIGRAAVQADTIGEQQSKRTRSGGEQQLKQAQSGSSSWTRGGGKRGAQAAVEADAAIGPGSSS